MTREISGFEKKVPKKVSEELKFFFEDNGFVYISQLVPVKVEDVDAETGLDDKDKVVLKRLIEWAKAEEAKEEKLKRLKIEENNSVAEKLAKKALAEEKEAEKFARETEKIKAENEKAGIAAPVCDFCAESDCAGHPHLNWAAGTNFLTDVEVQKYGFVEVPYLVEAGLSELLQFRIFIRDEALRLFQELETRKKIRIQGPPGVGKSITVWLWALIQARRHKKTVRWIHFGKGFYPRVMEFDASGYKRSLNPPFHNSFIKKCETDILVVDGISKHLSHIDVMELCRGLAARKACHVIVVHSEQAQIGERNSKDFLEFYMAGWTLPEYQKACEDAMVWISVKEYGTGPFVREIKYDTNDSHQEAFIVNRFFYAGSCARFFFYETVGRIRDIIRKAFDSCRDKAALISGSIGINWDNAVNTLMVRQGGSHTFVSDYAFITCSKDYTKYIVALEIALVATIANRPCHGIYYEHMFLKHLGNCETPSSLLDKKQGMEIEWNLDLPIVFLDNFIAAMGLNDVSIYLSWVYVTCKQCPAKDARFNPKAGRTVCRGREKHEYKTLTGLRKHMTDYHGWDFADGNAENRWGENDSDNYFKPDDSEIFRARNEYLSRFESSDNLKPADGELEIGQWLIPSRFNNEGFDCIFRENESTLVLVQITISNSHSMKMDAFIRISEYVKIKYPKIDKAKIVYIVPKTVRNYGGLKEASDEYREYLDDIEISVEGTKSIYQFHPAEANRFLCST